MVRIEQLAEAALKGEGVLLRSLVQDFFVKTQAWLISLSLP